MKYCHVSPTDFTTYISLCHICASPMQLFIYYHPLKLTHFFTLNAYYNLNVRNSMHEISVKVLVTLSKQVLMSKFKKWIPTHSNHEETLNKIKLSDILRNN